MTAPRGADALTHHPATYAPGVIERMVDIGRRWEVESILDHQAGTGKIREVAEALGVPWLGVDIEPEWAAYPGVICGDARRLPFEGKRWDATFFSPGYANRMGDQYLGNAANEKCRQCLGVGSLLVEATGESRSCTKCNGTGKAKSSRMGYAISLGRKVSDGSGCRYGSFSRGYRELHSAIIDETMRVTRRLIVLNVSDSLAEKQRQYVSQWWIEEMLRRGARFMEGHTVPTARMRHGANWDSRVDGEQVLVFGVADAREARLL